MHRSRVPHWLRVCIVLLFSLSFVAATQLGCPSNPPVEEKTPDSGPGDTGGSTCAQNSECPTGQACINTKCQVPACTDDSGCTGGKKCQNGTCVGGEGCTDDAQCPPGQSCQEGQCKEGPTGGAEPAKVEIVEQGGVLREGQTKQFTARVLNKAGATITGDFTLAWNSSATDSVSVDAKGLATGGGTDGEASITVKLGELTSEAVKVRNYAKVEDGKARLIVVDESQNAVSGAKVKIGDKEGDTDANGVVVIEGATAPFDVHIFHNDYSYFSAYGVQKTDLFVQLSKNPDTSKAGGVQGEFEFSQLQKLFGIGDTEWQDEYVVGFGIAGISLEPNILNLDFDLLIGESFKINLFGQNLSLPSGVVVALASGGKPNFQSLGSPGRKLLWGFGGKFKLEEVTPIISGATGGDLDIGKILASAKPLFARFGFGFKADVQISEYPRVADTEDKNGDGKTDDMIPDFDKFPTVKIGLNAKLDKTIPVNISKLPKPMHNGKAVDLLTLTLAGVIIPGIGIVPLGLDVAQATADTTKLELKYAEATGVLKTGTYAVITLALNIPSGDDAPPLMIFGDIKQGTSYPSTVTIDTFLDLGTPKYDKDARKLEGATSAGATLYQLEVNDDKGRKWLVVFDGSANGSITLPAPPSGFEDRAASAKDVSYRPVKLSDSQDMNTVLEFNSINMDKLVNVIASFSNTTVYEAP